jgi:rubrerythrin
MDFLDTALELERETISRYKNLAEQCGSHQGIRRILTMLVEDHEKHTAGLERMRRHQTTPLEGADVFHGVRGVLESIRQKKDMYSCDMDQLKLYREARDLIGEKKRFYEQVLTQVKSEEDRTLIGQLIREEDKQLFVLNNIIEMVDRPNQWLEDAEFNHLSDY